MINFVTPKAGAKHGLLYNNPASVLFKKDYIKMNSSIKHASLFCGGQVTSRNALELKIF
jgi:hypothetical protein